VAADPHFTQRVLSVLVVGKRTPGHDDDNHDQQNTVAAHGSVSSPVSMIVIIISITRARRTPGTGLSNIEATADDRGIASPMITVPHADDFGPVFRRVRVAADQARRATLWLALAPPTAANRGIPSGPGRSGSLYWRGPSPAVHVLC
jgi:hypothetical protein